MANRISRQMACQRLIYLLEKNRGRGGSAVTRVGGQQYREGHSRWREGAGHSMTSVFSSLWAGPRERSEDGHGR